MDSEQAKILVVDDIPQNVKLLADLLTLKGYAVVTASNGEEALAQGRLREARPRPARRDDARHVRVRRLPPHPRRPGDRAAAGRAVHVARPAAGADQRHRRRRRRFPRQADQPAGALRARASLLRIKRLHDADAAAGRAARRLERDARAARRGAGRGERAAVAPEALLLAEARRADRRRQRRGSAEEPAARDRRRVFATCAASPRSPKPRSPRS